MNRKLKDFALHRIDITDGAVLETGCVYLVPLMEALSLPERIIAVANPKSSTGRIDVFTRLICEGLMNSTKYQMVTKAIFGLRFHLEHFIIVRKGSRLSQMRFRRGRPTNSDTELKRLHSEDNIVYDESQYI